MIRDVVMYRDGVRKDAADTLDAAVAMAHAGPDRFVWVDLEDPQGGEFHMVQEAFELHELAAEDIMEAHQRPKLDVFDDQALLALKVARYDDRLEQIVFSELRVLLGERFVVSVEHGGSGVAAQVRAVLDTEEDIARYGPAAVLYGVADHVVDGYGPVLEGLATDIDEVEEQVFSPQAPPVAERIYMLKREIVAFYRNASMLVDPLEQLASGRTAQVPDDLRHYFRDVHDHLVRIVAQLRGFRELLTSILEAHLAQIGVQQNADMRKISAWVAIAAAPTLIAGIYGMNFRFIPGADWRPGFFAVMAVVGGVCTGLYLLFRRSGWL